MDLAARWGELNRQPGPVRLRDEAHFGISIERCRNARLRVEVDAPLQVQEATMGALLLENVFIALVFHSVLSGSST